MAACNQECNKQLQGLAARLSAAEDNITNQFMGMSTLVSTLATNPLTSFSVTSLTSVYNSLPTGMELMQKLKDALPDVSIKSMKQLAMTMAANAVDTMAASLDATAAAMVAAATAAVDAAAATVTSAQSTLTAAIVAAAAAPTTINNAAVDTARLALSSAQHTFDLAGEAKILSSSFMQGQANIAKCKSLSMHLS